ncbi:MAG: MlaD family protein [Bacteroidales bacterium]|jgi:phospholipid/cholesterol/gamma-HCH transport system substrate-binding protein|nr:MlaD family protein [Bacteroidales bacterium]
MKLTTEFKIGLVGLLTIIILVLGINFLKGRNIFSSTNTYYAMFDNVKGMHESNYIYINGLKVGYVTNIKPVNEKTDKFLVTIIVKKNIKIPIDSKLTLYSDGVLGNKALRIDAGNSNQTLKNKGTLQGYIELGIMDQLSQNIIPMFNNLSAILIRIDTLTEGLNNVLDKDGQNNLKYSLKNINSITERLDNVAKNVDGLVGTNKQKMNKIVANVESITSNLANNNKEINNIITRFDNITDTIEKKNIGKTLTNVNQSLQSLNVILNKIEKGKGNVGLLLDDDNLYKNLNSSAKNLDNLIEEIKKNPKKYLKISVF